LDFAERYRNLPFIGVLRPEMQNPPNWCVAKK
jgi:hypoxanthine phosphoribosyltransferase